MNQLMPETVQYQTTSIRSHLDRLSIREFEVLKLIVEGYSNPEIASALYLSVNTVRSHVRNILGKFGVAHRLQAAVFALRHGLV